MVVSLEDPDCKDPVLVFLLVPSTALNGLFLGKAGHSLNMSYSTSGHQIGLSLGSPVLGLNPPCHLLPAPGSSSVLSPAVFVAGQPREAQVTPPVLCPLAELLVAEVT